MTRHCCAIGSSTVARAIRVDRKLRTTGVIDVLDLFILRGISAYIRSDHRGDLVARAVPGWIAAVGAHTALIKPGSLGENGRCESFNSKLRDELLDGEIYYSLAEARIPHRSPAAADLGEVAGFVRACRRRTAPPGAISSTLQEGGPIGTGPRRLLSRRHLGQNLHHASCLAEPASGR